MALQTLQAAIYPFGHNFFPFQTPALGSITTLDAAGEYHAYVFIAREAMTISHVYLKCGGVSGSPTADIRIETVTAATGLPSGTLWATDTNIVTATLTTTGTVHALTASASIAKGDLVAVVIAYNSGTSIGLGYINGLPFNPGSLPYWAVNTGSPAKAQATRNIAIGIGSSSTAFYQLEGLFPFTTVSGATTFSNADGSRRGMRFRFPYPCRCAGGWAYVANSTGDFNIVLRDDAGNEINSSSTAVDASAMLNSTASSPLLYFDSPATLTKDTWYRLSIEPSSATNTSLTTMAFISADLLKGMPGGANCHYFTYTTAGGYVDTATDTLPLMGPIVDQLDNGVASVAIGYGTMSGGLQ